MIGLVQLVGVPNIHSKFGFALAYVVIGFVEGIILVSTPAMIRDFSPQMGRAAAMGFWALGPVVGSLVANLVANHTLSHLGPWQDQFMISGVVCMGVVVIASDRAARALAGAAQPADGVRADRVPGRGAGDGRGCRSSTAASFEIDVEARSPVARRWRSRCSCSSTTSL